MPKALPDRPFQTWRPPVGPRHRSQGPMRAIRKGRRTSGATSRHSRKAGRPALTNQGDEPDDDESGAHAQKGTLPRAADGQEDHPDDDECDSRSAGTFQTDLHLTRRDGRLTIGRERPWKVPRAFRNTILAARDLRQTRGDTRPRHAWLATFTCRREAPRG